MSTPHTASLHFSYNDTDISIVIKAGEQQAGQCRVESSGQTGRTQLYFTKKDQSNYFKQSICFIH